MENKKSSYRKTIDSLEERFNPDGDTVGDVIFRRVKFLGILMVIGLVYNFFFNDKSDDKTANTAQETVSVPRFEKKEYNKTYTDKVVADLKAKLPIQINAGKAKIISINHDYKYPEIKVDMVLQDASPRHMMQVTRYYCGTSAFKPLIEQNLYTTIRVLNENHSLSFEAEISGTYDFAIKQTPTNLIEKTK